MTLLSMRSSSAVASDRTDLSFYCIKYIDSNNIRDSCLHVLHLLEAARLVLLVG